MATSPQYIGTPKNGTLTANLATADTLLNNPTTFITVYTAGASGSRIDRVRIKAVATTAAGLVRLFISNDGGTNKRLLTEIAVSAITASATVPAFETEQVFSGGLVMQANSILYATTSVSQALTVIPTLAGDF